MASYPTIFVARRPKVTTWVPAVFAVLVICFESQNGLGAMRTFNWLSALLRWTGHSDMHAFAFTLNHYLRKVGHFSGYGLLGLCFARGWMSILRKRIRSTWSGLRLRAGGLGVASAFVVASCDEFHQVFLPSRGASVWDVLLDTSGALTLALLAYGYMNLRRRALVQQSSGTLTTLGLSLATLPHRVAGGESVRRLRHSAGQRMQAVQSRMHTASGLSVE